MHDADESCSVTTPHMTAMDCWLSSSDSYGSVRVTMLTLTATDPLPSPTGYIWGFAGTQLQL